MISCNDSQYPTFVSGAIYPHGWSGFRDIWANPDSMANSELMALAMQAHSGALTNPMYDMEALLTTGSGIHHNGTGNPVVPMSDSPVYSGLSASSEGSPVRNPNRNRNRNRNNERQQRMPSQSNFTCAPQASAVSMEQLFFKHLNYLWSPFDTLSCVHLGSAHINDSNGMNKLKIDHRFRAHTTSILQANAERT